MRRKTTRPAKLECRAYHEAGHGVAAIALHRGLESLDIIPNDDENRLGVCRSTRFPEWFRPDINLDGKAQAWLEREIIVLLAGEAAEAKFTGRRNRRGARSDLTAALDLASRVAGYDAGPGLYLDWLRFRAKCILNKSWSWRAVCYIAAELLARHRVSGRDARRLYRKAITR